MPALCQALSSTPGTQNEDNKVSRTVELCSVGQRPTVSKCVHVSDGGKCHERDVGRKKETQVGEEGGGVGGRVSDGVASDSSGIAKTHTLTIPPGP